MFSTSIPPHLLRATVLSSQMQHIQQNRHIVLFSIIIPVFFTYCNPYAKTAPASYYGNRGGSFALFVLFQALTQLLAGVLDSSLGGCQNYRAFEITTNRYLSVDSKLFHQSSTALTFRNASVFGFIQHITHILHSFNSSLTALPSHGSLEDRQSP